MTKKTKKTIKIVVLVLVGIIVVGFLIPERKAMPVGTPISHEKSGFWTWRGDHPHCGVDIFADAGTPITSNTGGIVVFAGYGGSKQGNSVTVLGPKWRIHNYYHLKDIDAKMLLPVLPGQQIGTVGNTGNAVRTPPHLHYELATLIPYVWRYFTKTEIDNYLSPIHRMERMCYLDPADHLPTK